MTEGSQHAGPTHRSVEVGVTVLIMIFAAIIIIGSLQAGIGWGAEGPKAGFFPFYIGLIILGASIINLVPVLAERGGGLFSEWVQLRQVMSVVVPTALYVALVPFIGIYAASVLLIAFFMKWLGRYDWARVSAISVAVPVVTFVIFEKWFLVPLPKGPIEEFLGL